MGKCKDIYFKRDSVFNFFFLIWLIRRLKFKFFHVLLERASLMKIVLWALSLKSCYCWSLTVFHQIFFFFVWFSVMLRLVTTANNRSSIVFNNTLCTLFFRDTLILKPQVHVDQYSCFHAFITCEMSLLDWVNLFMEPFQCSISAELRSSSNRFLLDFPKAELLIYHGGRGRR